MSLIAANDNFDSWFSFLHQFIDGCYFIKVTPGIEMKYLEQRAILWLAVSGLLPYQENQLDTFYGNDWAQFGTFKNDVMRAVEDYLTGKQPIEKLFQVLSEHFALPEFSELVLKHYLLKLSSSNVL